MILNNRGNIEICEKYKLNMPMYSVLYRNKLYVLLRHPFAENDKSGLVSFDIGKNMNLVRKSKTVSTMGEVACHLCGAKGKMYAVNYISGSIISMPDKIVIHKGKSVNPKRQEKAHAHFITPTPDGKYLLVTDLGMDKIITYTKELEPVCVTDSAAGSGPRHLVFSDNGQFVFCANELSSTISAYKYFNGTLTLYDEKSTLPNNCKIDNAPAAIRYSNDRIYVSNRGDDSIAVFDFNGEFLSQKAVFPCGGKSPRDFVVIDSFIVSANELSDSITVMDINGNIISSYTDVKRPNCITYMCNSII